MVRRAPDLREIEGAFAEVQFSYVVPQLPQAANRIVPQNLHTASNRRLSMYLPRPSQLLPRRPRRRPQDGLSVWLVELLGLIVSLPPLECLAGHLYGVSEILIRFDADYKSTRVLAAKYSL